MVEDSIKKDSTDQLINIKYQRKVTASTLILDQLNSNLRKSK